MSLPAAGAGLHAILKIIQLIYEYIYIFYLWKLLICIGSNGVLKNLIIINNNNNNTMSDPGVSVCLSFIFQCRMLRASITPYPVKHVLMTGLWQQ